MNKADNDASTRAIDSLINYEVSLAAGLSCFFFFLLWYLDVALFRLSFIIAYFHLILFSLFQTVKYFNNEAYEADKYDEYLKSKLLTCCFCGVHIYQFMTELTKVEPWWT